MLCEYGHGCCTAPDTKCPHWIGIVCELDEANKLQKRRTRWRLLWISVEHVNILLAVVIGICAAIFHIQHLKREKGMKFYFGHLCYKNTESCDMYEPKGD